MDSYFGQASPNVLRAGDTWNWTVAFEGYSPASGWALRLVLNSPTATSALPDASAVASGDGFAVSVASSVTANVVPGEYDLYPILTSPAGAKLTLPPTVLAVLPNISGAGQPVDTRSFAKRTLDMLEAAIAGDTSPMVQEYSIHGRSVRYIERKDLLAMRAQFRMEYDQERGISAPNRIELVF